ncbi:hypothetical protein A2454_03810 [Candidatus Peribacteria bacterium RIFOXYC2_FULL_55_14]|nr:MAG: hypothetical protein A2198_05065 [Candidatus Peribacteria bacterium RIFOXYA1_FULL_56_14]OGJ72938.1 MAG: hypothetical protein A2217_06575 [Candidatus Peribacteria bacterium RIFOXYA2_FULL_55_28]OGJ73927.1 MAG: hypothetical protein A2384_04845 [Candidatus Peribacteria bacterium RIFOXYB1_FULL_54_35]OGJ76104.1 MAG: hypothetical protein A2327_04315 [Candidatus Peribacteria bacterium RIFOXYB2_FULL_54_17]OGJ79564.1 MAG: hypothetical protein A2424_00800 [Candidatus Peribacteria bacterium RIFOXYC
MSKMKSPPPGTLREAVELAEKAHRGQKRASGEPYVEHPKTVAELLKYLHAGNETLIAAMLHDTVEDTDVTLKQLQEEFGPVVSKLVEGVTKVQKVEKDIDPHERSMQSIHKMFGAMGRDIRVIFIKLADRLHNMQTIGHLPQEKQQRIARETLDIFCPLANLLGIRLWYQELSDRALRVLDPAQYDLLERKRKSATDKNLKHLQNWVQRMRTYLRDNGFKNLKIVLLPRHLYSICESTHTQTALLQHIETFFHISVITRNQDDCYCALNYLHQFASSLPHHIQDYVAHPKTNGYRALHTTVMSSLGNPIKIIIQTDEMHQEGLFGAALPYQQHMEKKWQRLPTWIDQLLSLEHDTQDLPQFFQAVQSEIFGDRFRVHIVGEKQKFIDLPSHSSMLDVAFHIGDRKAMYVKNVIANSEPSSLKRIIQDGDVIEYAYAKHRNQRSAEDLVFVHTSAAQKLLVGNLCALPRRELLQHGRKIVSHTLDVTMDPFLSTAWKKGIANRLCSNKRTIEHVGCGLLNTFDLLGGQCIASDFFLVDPHLFQFTSRLTPKQRMRFILRTTLENLRDKLVIGQQIRPDVIDILSIDDEEIRQHAHIRELVPLTIGKIDLLQHPFHFALMWFFAQGSNPLKTIANLQNLLDTPLELREFNRSSLTLGFHTDRIGTLQIAYEYLSSQPDIERIVRISP